MEIITELIQEIDWRLVVKIGMRIVAIAFAAWLVQLVFKRVLYRIERKLVISKQREGEPPSESEKRVQTLMRLIKQAVVITLWVAVGLVILSQIGLNIAPILAGAGIIGLAVGFGAQNLVRDIISGFFIILENQVRVGDVAVLNGVGGLVEEISAS